MLGATNIWDEHAQLLRLGKQDLILIVGALPQERDQLAACALLAQGQGNCAQSGDGVQSANGLIALQLIAAQREEGMSVSRAIWPTPL